MKKKISASGEIYFTDERPEILCDEVYGSDYKRFLADFIPYLEATSESSWVDIIFANKDTSKRCVIYHFLGFVGQDCPDVNNSRNLDWYESHVCFIQRAGCEVNDGNHPDYKQPTPKQRSIAYLKNLLDGLELTPVELLDQFMCREVLA